MPKISYIVNQAPVMCTTCPLRWRSAASDPDLILRALRIRILSGCVGGFFIPKSGGTSTHKCAFCYFYCIGLARPAKA